MPIYQQRGSIPNKRHIQHYYKKGKLCYEEHISREGFSDIYSNVYHIHPPTKISKYSDFIPLDLKPSEERVHRHHHLELFNIKPDLTCLGKIIGGGLPVGAYGGRKDIMAYSCVR